MRVVSVSTYPLIECGIGTYTGFLVEALTKLPNEIHIISQYGAEGRHVYPSYCPGEDGIARKIFNAVNRVTPDIVHIQHEFGLYGELDGIAVLELIYRLKSTFINNLTLKWDAKPGMYLPVNRKRNKSCPRKDNRILSFALRVTL